MFQYDDAVMVTGLTTNTRLNSRIARIFKVETKVSYDSGKVLRACSLLVGDERFWCPEENLVKISCKEDLLKAEFCEVPQTDREDVTMYLFANSQSTTLIPGVGRIFHCAPQSAPQSAPHVGEQSAAAKDDVP